MGILNIIRLSLVIIYLTSNEVESHGRMLDPPQRTSMWRFGFKTLINYDDNAQNCGGMWNQWEINDGKCGVCGAPWQGPRENEAGGKYALGIISREYIVDAQIPVTIEITANHRGYFEFKLCPNDDNSTAETQECLDRYVLEVVGTTADVKTRYYPGIENKKYSMTLQLPKGVTCTKCMMQWRYHTGNSWGCADSGTCCVGCGEKQEEFYGCADISIDGTVSMATVTDAFYPTTADTTDTTVIKSTATKKIMPTTTDITDIKQTEVAHTTEFDVKIAKYYSIGINTSPAMDIWCQNNCPRGFCPTDLCRIGEVTNCQAVKTWENVQCLNDWCRDNCPLGTCPSDLCICS